MMEDTTKHSDDVLHTYGTKGPSIYVSPSSANCDRLRLSGDQMYPKENQLEGLRKLTWPLSGSSGWCCRRDLDNGERALLPSWPQASVWGQ